MMQNGESSDLNFINLAMEALRGRRYRDAFTSLDDGIDRYLDSREEINSEKLLKKLKVLLTYLEFRLGEDFGAYWEEQAAESETELRCSFCGERKSEERKIIAGPGVFIGNDCISGMRGSPEE